MQLNGLITVPLMADSGSDWTIVPSAVLEELQALQLDLHAKDLSGGWHQGGMCD